MKRRQFLQSIAGPALAAAPALATLAQGASWAAAEQSSAWIDPATARDWRTRWEKYILGSAAKKRYCDTEMARGTRLAGQPLPRRVLLRLSCHA